MSKRLKSFVEIAAHSDFPLENLPYGIFSEKQNSQPRAGVALGEWVIDLAVWKRMVIAKWQMANCSLINRH